MAEENVAGAADAATTGGSTGTDASTNGSAAPAVDTQTGGNQQAGGSSASSGSTPSGSDIRAVDGDGSLTADTETIPPDPAEESYKARFSGLSRKYDQERARAQQLHQRLQELEAQAKRYEGIPLDRAVQQYQAVQGLKPWDDGHPDFGRFQQLWSQAQWANELARSEPDPAVKKAILDRHFDAIADADRQLLQEHMRFVRAEQQQQAMNPAAYLQRQIQRHAQPVVQQNFQNVAHQQQQVMQATASVQKWISENAELATKENREAIANLMQTRNLPFEHAVVQWERDHYRGKVSGIDAKARSVEEKERLLQGKAAGIITRNPSTKQGVSVSGYLKEKGIPTSDGNGVANAILDLQARGVNLVD